MSKPDCPKCGGTHFGDVAGNCPLSKDYKKSPPWPKAADVLAGDADEHCQINLSVPEERSRFEKWWTAELPGKSWTSADIDNMQLAWRAALEDRQEAAPPKDTTKSICGCIMCEFHVSAAEIRDRQSAVPPEATPTEMEMEMWKLDCQRRGGEIVYAETADQITATTVVGTDKFVLTDTQEIPAPAPEVQGTPRSSGKLIHDATIQKGGEFVVTTEEFEIMCAATPGPKAVGAPLFCGKKLRVGTPQKETPTKEFIGTVRRRLFIPVDHEWNGIVREVTAKHESDEMVPVTAVLDDLAAFYRQWATLAILKWHLNGEDTMKFFADNADLKNPLPNPAPVPEGVQGKEPEYAGTEDAEPEGDFVGIGRNGPTVRPAPEPQTFEEFWRALSRKGDPERVPNKIETGWNAGFVSGEAAGRRSAARAIKAVLENDAISLSDLVGAVETLCA